MTKTESKERIDYLIRGIKEETAKLAKIKEKNGVDRNGWVSECSERFLSNYKKEVNALTGLKIY